MHHKSLPAWAACLALASVSPGFAGETGESDPVPDMEVLESAIVIDCGQWPTELDQQLAAQFRSNCQENSKLMGYSQAWTLTLENIPETVFRNPNSFRCKAVAEENIGYFCVGIREP